MYKRRITGVILCAVLILSFFCSCSKETEDTSTAENSKNSEEIISIVAFGDNLMHMPVVNSGKKEDGTYEYSPIFAELQPTIRDADIAVIGQETAFAGKDKGYSGFPLFNTPSDVGKSLVNEGFDVVLLASNHILDKWAAGAESTLEFWDGYPQVTVLGLNKSQQDKYQVKVIEKKGAKIALLNYTYGTNGISLPNGKEYLVNYIEEEKVRKDVTYAEENTDFTIAFMHWGTEYSVKPDAYQRELAQKMCDWGVDLIVGAHPHVIEPMEWLTGKNGNKTLVYYSLGNFVSRQKEARNLLGAMADVKLSFDGSTVTVAEYSFVPLVTHYNMTSTKFTVYRLSEYNNQLAAAHGVGQYDGAVSVERWQDMVEGVFEGYDTSAVEGIGNL